ncbi:PROTEIN TMA23 [Ceraceosorus bombacis]|uniref:PROTEIN TMA23 n=1 Tax=Ceraceosorus bombacis TaxID=401625 RepID=A0A0P1BCR6_9BASI|nr:PROTEIN TMA23 [Ceraceosorus bombacis]
MPLNTSTYMQSQGWAGQGNPLGLNGSGLKKPLAIPQKRGLKGIGKDRDRANEWWDCLFEASAKALALPSAASSLQTTTAPSSSFTSTSTTSAARLSLIASAKRESAKKALMAGFVRGKVHLEWSEKQRAKENAMLDAAPSPSRKEAASTGSETLPRLTARKEKEAEVVPVQMQVKSAQKEEKVQRRLERLRVKEVEKREKEEGRARREAKRRKKEEKNAKVIQ